MNATLHLVAQRPASPSGTRPAVRSLARRAQEYLIWLTDLLAEWQERSAQRHRLGGLDDRMLRDIGADYSAAAGEADKWFWRA